MNCGNKSNKMASCKPKPTQVTPGAWTAINKK